MRQRKAEFKRITFALFAILLALTFVQCIFVVGGVAEVRTGNDLQMFVRKHVPRRTDDIFSTSHDKGRPLCEFDGEVFQRQ